MGYEKFLKGLGLVNLIYCNWRKFSVFIVGNKGIVILVRMSWDNFIFFGIDRLFSGEIGKFFFWFWKLFIIFKFGLIVNMVFNIWMFDVLIDVSLE